MATPLGIGLRIARRESGVVGPGGQGVTERFSRAVGRARPQQAEVVKAGNEILVSRELSQKLLQWRRPGFSAFVGEPFSPEDSHAIEDVASYLVRNPLSLKKLVYIDGQKAVLYHSKMNPGLGRNFEAPVIKGSSRMARSPFRSHPGSQKASHVFLWLLRQPNARRPQPGKTPSEVSFSFLDTWARLIQKVYSSEGESRRAAENCSLALFHVKTSARVGEEAWVETSIEIDVNGIVQLEVVDLVSRESARFTVRPPSDLTADEVRLARGLKWAAGRPGAHGPLL